MQFFFFSTDGRDGIPGKDGQNGIDGKYNFLLCYSIFFLHSLTNIFIVKVHCHHSKCIYLKIPEDENRNPIRGDFENSF